MKKIYPFGLIILLGVVFFACPSFAEDIYVAGVTKITMRTGPGVENKIVAMLNSGDKLEIMEYKWDWSQVKTDQGKIGWVLSRFLTQDIPDAFLMEQLKKDIQAATARIEALEAENKMLADQNAAFLDIKEKYNTLKQESADFLNLEVKYQKIMTEFEAQKGQINTLENNLNTEQKFWFLSGAGVFILGLILGLIPRKKKRNSLL